MELPKEIQRARELGDLRENAEYQAAKERQTYVNARIAMLKRRESEIALMNMDRIPHGKAGFGSTVTLREKDQEMVYQLVMPEDAERREGPHLHLVADRPRHPQQGRRRRRHGVDAQRHPQVRNPQARHHPRRSDNAARVTEPRDSYSPERRTALLFTGTGADGAYHAGAMRALQEAGVKIDIVGGRGIGAVSAVLAAVDGSAQLWEDERLLAIATRCRTCIGGGGRFGRCACSASASSRCWPCPRSSFRPRCSCIRRRWSSAWPACSPARGSSRDSSRCCRRRSRRRALPSWLPRLALLLCTAALIVLGAGAWLARWRSPLYRRSTGSWLWTLLGSPLDASVAAEQATETVWRLLKGSATIKTPEPEDLSRRYSELLTENLGQPGFRELLLVVHDLDAHRDLVFGLVRDPYRRALFPPPGGGSSAPGRGARPRERHAGVRRRRARRLAERAGRQRRAARRVRAGLVLARRDASPDRSAGVLWPVARRGRRRRRRAGGHRRRHRRAAWPA